MAVINTEVSARTLAEMARGFAAVGGKGNPESEAMLIEAFKDGISRTRLLNYWLKTNAVEEIGFHPGRNSKEFRIRGESFFLHHSEPYPSAHMIAHMTFAIQYGPEPEEDDNGK